MRFGSLPIVVGCKPHLNMHIENAVYQYITITITITIVGCLFMMTTTELAGSKWKPGINQ